MAGEGTVLEVGATPLSSTVPGLGMLSTMVAAREDGVDALLPGTLTDGTTEVGKAGAIVDWLASLGDTIPGLLPAEAEAEETDPLGGSADLVSAGLTLGMVGTLVLEGSLTAVGEGATIADGSTIGLLDAGAPVGCSPDTGDELVSGAGKVSWSGVGGTVAGWTKLKIQDPRVEKC